MKKLPVYSKPNYIKAFNKSLLQEKILKVEKIYKSCTLCPHNCRVDRFNSRDGICKSGDLPIIASYGAHFGEEEPLVGENGSGVIFFGRCNLHCVFCQNCDISQLEAGADGSNEELADIMLKLQAKGCHNINFVSPGHMVLPILKALEIAIEGGLSIPLVYNTGGYDSVETLQILEGFFDIYMPDFKYFSDELGEKYSLVKNYGDVAQKAIKEMYRQVGDLQMDINEIAQRGLIIRHLILPGHIEETLKIIDSIAGLSKRTYLNLMDQYHPAHKAREYRKLKHRITTADYKLAVNTAIKAGLRRLDG